MRTDPVCKKRTNFLIKRKANLTVDSLFATCRNFSTEIEPSTAIFYSIYIYNKSYFFDLYIGLL